MIFKYGLIGECARVAIEAKVRRNAGRTQESDSSDCS